MAKLLSLITRLWSNLRRLFSLTQVQINSWPPTKSTGSQGSSTSGVHKMASGTRTLNGVNGYGVLRPEMFKHYDKMNPSFLKFLDLVLQGAGYTPDTIVITSDWRDPQTQH